MFYKHSCGCIVLKESLDSLDEILVMDCDGFFKFIRQKTEDYPYHNRGVVRVIAETERLKVFEGIQSLFKDGLKFRELKEILGE